MYISKLLTYLAINCGGKGGAGGIASIVELKNPGSGIELFLKGLEHSVS